MICAAKRLASILVCALFLKKVKKVKRKKKEGNNDDVELQILHTSSSVGFLSKLGEFETICRRLLFLIGSFALFVNLGFWHRYETIIVDEHAQAGKVNK